MPTALRSGPYRFFFYAGDRHEPPHIHVERDGRMAKFWLDPVKFHSSNSFTGSELREIQRLVQLNVVILLESWHDYFGT